MFKKPTKKGMETTGATGVGVVGGALIGRGADAFITKEKKNRTMVKGALLLAGLVSMACVNGNDTVSSVVKGVGMGLVAEGGLSLANEFSLDSDLAKEPAEDGSIKEFLKAALGLPNVPGTNQQAAATTKGMNGCGCEYPGLNYAHIDAIDYIEQKPNDYIASTTNVLR